MKKSKAIQRAIAQGMPEELLRGCSTQLDVQGAMADWKASDRYQRDRLTFRLKNFKQHELLVHSIYQTLKNKLVLDKEKHDLQLIVNFIGDGIATDDHLKKAETLILKIKNRKLERKNAPWGD